MLKAARLNIDNVLGHNINAIISLGPTDHYGTEVLAGAYSTPYIVLYGSRDGDVGGGSGTGIDGQKTGFSLYRANGSDKSMAFVYRATHNGFITTNFDGPLWGGENAADLLEENHQKAITKAYMNAFFRRYLKNETVWQGIFTGEW